MRTLFLGLALLTTASAVPTPLGPPKVEARGQFNPWTFGATPGALVARRDGKEVWHVTGSLKTPDQLQLWVTPQRVLLLSRENGWRGMNVVLSAYRLVSGKPLWTRRLYEHHGAFDVQLAGTVGRAVLVTTGGGDVHWPDVWAFDLASGDAMWRMGGPLLGKTDTEVLAANPGVGDPNQNVPASAIPLMRAEGTYREGGSTDFTLRIPARPGCGPMTYQTGFPDLRFTDRYLYAFRRDSCGKFIARFDWHGAAGQTPLMYPDRREPTPSVPLKYPETP